MIFENEIATVEGVKEMGRGFLCSLYGQEGVRWRTGQEIRVKCLNKELKCMQNKKNGMPYANECPP